MGRRSRKSGAAAPGSVRRTPPPPAAAERARAQDPAVKYAERQAKAEARNAAVRAKLKPLDPDEHPRALKFAIGTCVVLAISNGVSAALGRGVAGDDPTSADYVQLGLYTAVLLMAAWGMFKHRYWAVLGFQALLALTVLIAGLSVVVASNVLALVLCLFIIAYGGWLFWSMIRVMARVQMPEARRPR